MRFEKNISRIFNLVKGITRRRGWPLENGLGDGVNNLSCLIEEKHSTILKHMMKSATKRPCMLKRLQFQVNEALGICQILESRQSFCERALDVFNSIDEIYSRGRPNRWGIFNYWTNVNFIGEYQIGNVRDKKQQNMSADRWRARPAISRVWMCSLSLLSIVIPRSLAEIVVGMWWLNRL